MPALQPEKHMKKLICYLLPAVFLCVCCAKEKGTESRLQVSVSTSVPGTRGAGETTAATLRTTSFGLFGYYRDAGYSFDGVDEARRLMDNARMSFVGSGAAGDRWVCDPAVFWPLGCSGTFFAYAPYMDCSGGVLTLPNADASPMLRGTFAVPAEVEEQIDFCLGAPVLDWTPSMGDVPVSFGHALTKVLFYLNVDGSAPVDDDHVYRVKSIVLDGVAGENRFTFGGGSGWRWDILPRSDLSSRTGSYSLSLSDGTLDAVDLPFASDRSEESGLDRFECVNGRQKGILYLLPQPLTPLAGVTFQLAAYRYDAVSGEWYEDPEVSYDPVSVPLPETTVWEPGRSVCYSATLDMTYLVDLQFGVTMADWDGNVIGDVEFGYE